MQGNNPVTTSTESRIKMALGDQSKALIIVSKNKGWDPTVIADGESIANFNKAPDPWKLGNQSVGNLPGGTPDGWPDSYGPPATPSVGATETNWSQGATNDNQKRGTSGANPYAGKMEG